MLNNIDKDYLNLVDDLKKTILNINKSFNELINDNSLNINLKKELFIYHFSLSEKIFDSFIKLEIFLKNNHKNFNKKETSNIFGVSYELRNKILLNLLDKNLLHFNQLSKGITIGLVRTFLSVCLNPGFSLSKHCEALNLTKSNVSRYLIELGKSSKAYQNGMGLVSYTKDSDDIRKKSYNLTEKGYLLSLKLINNSSDSIYCYFNKDTLNDFFEKLDNNVHLSSSETKKPIGVEKYFINK